MLDSLTNLITILLGLSIASERLVEIAKDSILSGWLGQDKTREMFEFSDNKPNEVPSWLWWMRTTIQPNESWRKAIIQFLAVAAGIVTSILSKPAINELIGPEWTSWHGLIALGLLASGGSGFWNSILGYAQAAKSAKNAEVSQ